MGFLESLFNIAGANFNSNNYLVLQFLFGIRNKVCVKKLKLNIITMCYLDKIVFLFAKVTYNKIVFTTTGVKRIKGQTPPDTELLKVANWIQTHKAEKPKLAKGNKMAESARIRTNVSPTNGNRH